MTDPNWSDESLRAALQALEHSVPDGGKPSSPVFHRGSVIPSVVSVLMFGAGAILLIAISRTWTYPSVPGPSTSPAGSFASHPSHGSVPTTSPASPPFIEWTTDSFPGQTVTAAEASSNQWVAIGPGEAWLSPDGTEWQRGAIGSVEVSPPSDPEFVWASPEPVDASRHGEAWYAVARWQGPLDAQRPVVYQSPDGLNWTHLPSSEW